MAVLDGAEVVYHDKIQASHTITMSPGPGHGRRPAAWPRSANSCAGRSPAGPTAAHPPGRRDVLTGIDMGWPA